MSHCTPQERVWTTQQQAIFDEVQHGAGHLVVIARAGTGKTTTLVEAVKRIPDKKVLLCAFNKSIATELQQRAPAHCDVKTLHSLGYAAVMKVWGRVRLDDKRELEILLRKAPLLEYEDKQLLRKLVSLCKATMTDEGGAIMQLAAEYGIEPESCNPGTAAFVTMNVLKQSQQYDGTISFDDMVYVPAALGLKTGSYDVVVVDETQDMNRAQLLCAQAALAPGGRLIVIGEDRQAMYRFRGADTDSIQRIRKALKPAVLSLTTSYRCPQSVASLARQVCPDFQVPMTAPVGEVVEMPCHRASQLWTSGDYVLSRTNAPLAKACLEALRNGEPAYIQGRDVGAGLSALVKRSKARSIIDLQVWLVDYRQQEFEKLTAKGKPEKIEDVDDRIDALDALCDGLTTTSELLARLESLFSDDQNTKRLMFSSVHRAKGLESDRVFVLTDTFRGGSVEEENLWYVAVTRSKRNLFLVGGLP